MTMVRNTLAIWWVVVLMVGLSGFLGDVGGQTVQGRLLESGTERPIMVGQVALLDTTMNVLERTITDHQGRFSLTAPGPGSYYVVADRLGYVPVIDGIVELGQDGYLPVEFYLRPQPVELEPIVATARREQIVRKLTNQGFYQREDMGFGHFIPPSEIERRAPSEASDLLRGVPGLQFMDQGIFGEALFMRGGGPRLPSRDQVRRRLVVEPERQTTAIDSVAPPEGYCRPRLFVDGAPILGSRVSSGGGVVLDALVNVRDVVGVEVYTRASNVPLQYGGMEDCGVILIWTGG